MGKRRAGPYLQGSPRPAAGRFARPPGAMPAPSIPSLRHGALLQRPPPSAAPAMEEDVQEPPSASREPGWPRGCSPPCPFHGAATPGPQSQAVPQGVGVGEGHPRVLGAAGWGWGWGDSRGAQNSPIRGCPKFPHHPLNEPRGWQSFGEGRGLARHPPVHFLHLRPPAPGLTSKNKKENPVWVFFFSSSPAIIKKDSPFRALSIPGGREEREGRKGKKTLKERRGRAREGEEKGRKRDGEKLKAEITQRELLYL